MIHVKNMSIEFPEFSVRDIDLSVTQGEFFALIGPTGAGKTLILEAIAGVAPITRGRILICGNDVTRLPPEKRNVGIVYQDLGLFPHLNVMENIKYGLRYHRDPAIRTDSESRINRLIDLLGLERIMDRSMEYLSGGEKQRIALARCLAVNPSLVLLDEPLSSLDVNKRDEVQLLLKDLHENFQTTFLMVTHEFSQVMFLADRVAIINSGALEQIGPVSQVFERPRTPFVAKFLGMKNLWPATFNGRYAQVDRLQIRVTSENTSGMKYLGLRPENIRIHTEEPADGAENVFPVQITGVWNVGPYYEVRAQADEVVFSAFLTSGPMPKLHLKRGVRAHISFDSESVHIL